MPSTSDRNRLVYSPSSFFLSLFSSPFGNSCEPCLGRKSQESVIGLYHISWLAPWRFSVQPACCNKFIKLLVFIKLYEFFYSAKVYKNIAFSKFLLYFFIASMENFTSMKKMPIFALSSFIHKRTDVRLFPQIGIFYARLQPICGTVTPCQSSNARQLVYSSTTGSAVPFFLLPLTTSNCFNICRKCTTMAGRYIVVNLPARPMPAGLWPSCSLPQFPRNSKSPTTVLYSKPASPLPPGSLRSKPLPSHCCQSGSALPFLLHGGPARHTASISIRCCCAAARDLPRPIRPWQRLMHILSMCCSALMKRRRRSHDTGEILERGARQGCRASRLPSVLPELVPLPLQERRGSRFCKHTQRHLVRLHGGLVPGAWPDHDAQDLLAQHGGPVQRPGLDHAADGDGSVRTGRHHGLAADAAVLYYSHRMEWRRKSINALKLAMI